MTRPKLTKDIVIDDFTSFYWLKEELCAFCRELGLPAGGSKQELAARIGRFLENGQASLPAQESKPVRKPQSGQMPCHFSRQSVIGSGWRCSQELRVFFEAEIGKSFHFDGVMRDLIHHGAGKTLEEVIMTWKAERQTAGQKKEIAPQFEYNRFIRDYFNGRPGASMAEVIQAWNEHKQARRGKNRIVETETTP